MGKKKEASFKRFASGGKTQSQALARIDPERQEGPVGPSSWALEEGRWCSWFPLQNEVHCSPGAAHVTEVPTTRASTLCSGITSPGSAPYPAAGVGFLCPCCPSVS